MPWLTAPSLPAPLCVAARSYVPLNAFLEQKVQQENAMARPDLGAAGLGSRSRRMAESAESDGACAGGEGNALPVSPKSLVPQGRPVAGRPQQVALCVFRAACRKVLVFARLDDAHFDQLHSVMVEHVVDAGTVVLNEGEQGTAASRAVRCPTQRAA